MKIRTTLFLFTLFLSPLAAQNSVPIATPLTTLADIFSRQLTTLASDTSLTFEQVQPIFANLFEQYRRKTRHTVAKKADKRFLIVVTLDGFRWQEVFGGADSLLLHNVTYTSDTAAYHHQYWAATASERRQRLLPFFWSILQEQGQLYGNRAYQNHVNVANSLWFSYPGYNELLTGRPDDGRIYTNAKLPNPNENVLEYISRQKGFRNKVVAFGSWDVFSAIFNEKRARFSVNSAGENRTDRTLRATNDYFDLLRQNHPAGWPKKECFDAFTRSAAADYLQRRHPRLAYIGLGDTDEAAHAGHYDRYLDAARETDQWLAELWQFLQQDPVYRGRTTLLITTDHGRGSEEPRQWRDHSRHVPGSDQVWLAAIGPDSPALGEVALPMQIYQQQIAQTIAQLLGCTFLTDHTVAPAISSIYKKMLEGHLTAKN